MHKDFVYRNAKGKIIELGCGDSPYFNHSIKVDIRRFKNYLCFDLNSPFLIEEKFDTVIATEVIEHLWNADNFLSECHRILNEDGILILSTPNVKYWKTRLRLLFGFSVFDEESYKKRRGFGGHLRFYTPERLTRTLEEHGFTVKELRPIGRMRILNFCGDFILKAKKR